MLNGFTIILNVFRICLILMKIKSWILKKKNLNNLPCPKFPMLLLNNLVKDTINLMKIEKKLIYLSIITISSIIRIIRSLRHKLKCQYGLREKISVEKNIGEENIIIICSKMDYWKEQIHHIDRRLQIH